IDNDELARLKALEQKPFKGFQSKTISILFPAASGAKGMQKRLEEIFAQSSEAIKAGCNLLILSDRGVDETNAPIPSLLATGGLPRHLVREGTRTKVGLVIETGEPREVHHFGLLVGYGAGAINPYLAFETLDDLIREGILENTNHRDTEIKYIRAIKKGI